MLYPYIWTKWVVEIMKIGQLILIVFVVKILVWKPNSYLFFYLFIFTTLDGFTQYTCYTCFKLYKKLCTPNTRKHYQAHFLDHYQTLENQIVFQKILSKKWPIFQKTLMLKTLYWTRFSSQVDKAATSTWHKCLR